ncbi:hypothetical protein [Salinigranum marinum]|uniref:hypothetical protein n=1 Tax=Salinigranum marinum TaxID=1515595 RepID=UPI002989F53F|nr:hypothetical protein [Salinigranum marinum]
MQAEGCNPQCPVTNNELQPGDRLRPGSFTLTADEEGSYPILIRVVYTLNNGDNRSWTRVQDISLSVQDDSPPTLVERISGVLSTASSRVYPSLINYFPSILFAFVSLPVMYKYNNRVAERLAWSLKQGRIGADVIVFLLIVTIPINSYFITAIIAAFANLSGEAGSGLFIMLCICNCVMSVIEYAIGALLKWVELNIILLVFTLSYTILQTLV